MFFQMLSNALVSGLLMGGVYASVAIGLTLILAAFAPGLAALLTPQYLSLFARLALAVFSVGLMLCGLLSLTVGLVLHSIARRSQELEYHLQILTDELRPDLRQRERIHADEASAGLS